MAKIMDDMDASFDGDFPLGNEADASFAGCYFSIPELAAMSNTSKATLNRLFRKYLNTSPQAYLNSLRMENAKNLIRRGNLSFKEIAEQLGFRNSLYFSTSFKKYTGVAPSEFRKECGTSE